MGTITLQNLSIKQNKKTKKYTVNAGGPSTNTWDCYGRRCYEKYTNVCDSSVDTVINLVNWIFETRSGHGSYKILAMFAYCNMDFPNYEDDWKETITEEVADKLLNAYKEVVKKNRIVYISNIPLAKSRISNYGAHAEYAYNEKSAKIMTFAEYVALKSAFSNYEVSQKHITKPSQVVA